MEPKYTFNSVDELIEIECDGSQPITPRPKVTPILSEEEQAIADAVRRFQNEHRRALLNWRDIFEIVHSLGYRKVGQSPKPPESNGSPQNPPRSDDAGNEKS